jgi:hypothetical protein
MWVAILSPARWKAFILITMSPVAILMTGILVEMEDHVGKPIAVLGALMMNQLAPLEMLFTSMGLAKV